MSRLTTLMGLGILAGALIVGWGPLGCASAPVSRSDIAGSIAWHAIAFQRVLTTVQDRPAEQYTFTLRLREHTGVGITWTRHAQPRQAPRAGTFS